MIDELIDKYYKKRLNTFKTWALNRIFGLFIFNLTVIMLMLLHTAGYFAPFFPLTINVIVMVALILAVLLLGIGSNTLFFLGLFFWIFAAFLKLVGVEVWAERTAIYSYQSLILALALFIIEIRKVNGKIKNG